MQRICHTEDLRESLLDCVHLPPPPWASLAAEDHETLQGGSHRLAAFGNMKWRGKVLLRVLRTHSIPMPSSLGRGNDETLRSHCHNRISRLDYVTRD